MSSPQSDTVAVDGPGTHPWTETFAIWPVKTVSGKWVWWKKLFWRRVWIEFPKSMTWETEIQYGTIFDVIDTMDQYSE